MNRLAPPTSSVMPLIMAATLFVAVSMGVVVAQTGFVVGLAIVAGIGIFIGSFASVKFALYVLIFATLLSPEFGARGTQGGGVTLRVDDFLLLVISFSQLTRSAIYRQVGIFSWTPLNRYITYYMLACVFSTGAGIMFGQVRVISGFFFVLKYFEYFIVYFLLVNNLESKDQTKRFLVAILLTAFVVSFVAIAQIPGGKRVAAPFEGEDGEPNTLGGYLMLIGCVVGGLLFTRNAVQQTSHKLALLGLLGMMAIPILFTLSRATWLAAVPAGLAFLLFSDHRASIAALLAIVVVISPFVLPKEVKERALYTVSKERTQFGKSQQEQVMGITFDTSSSARIRQWKVALDDFPRHPVLGYGITGWRFIDAQYLRVLLETGLIGLATFMALLWAVIRQAWLSYRNIRDPMFRGVALGFLVGTFSLMVHALMANTFIIVRIMEPFWLLAAIVVGGPQLEEVEAELAEKEAIQAADGARQAMAEVGIEPTVVPSARLKRVR